MNLWISAALGIGLMAVWFLLAWCWAVKINNYSVVDAAWAFGIGFTGITWLLVCGNGSVKHWVAVVLLGAWSLRLTWHLERRIRRAHPVEDARYVKLSEVWVGREKSAFFGFFQAQGASVVLLSLPFLFIAADPVVSWSFWESIGVIVLLTGILGEGLADSQMSRFKAGNSDSKAVCQVGLWRYSRHPNYFFEAIIWFGFYLYACGSEWGWVTIHAPLIIVFLLLRVTGIPPTEAAALRRKGEAYRIYQQTTSPFIPWPPRPFKP